MAVRAHGVERRDEILQATIGLVSELGHQSVRVVDVAKRLDVSAGLIIYHFGTKEELLGAAFACAAECDLQTAREITEREADAQARLFALVDWYLPTSESSRSWRMWLDGWAASQFDESLGQVIRRFDDAWCELFAEAIGEVARARGKSRVDVSWVHAEAVQLAAFVNGLTLRSMTGAERIEGAQLTAWARRYLRDRLGAGG